MDGESDAALLADDGTIVASDTLVEGQEMTVKLSKAENPYYYKFTPESDGDYYFAATECGIVGFRENSNNRIENAYGLMRLNAGKNYYFYFCEEEGCYGDETHDVTLLKKIALDSEKTSIRVSDTYCEIVEGRYFSLPDVDYTLTYVNGKVTTGSTNDSVDGLYNDCYDFRLESQKDNKLYYLDDDEGFPVGKYNLCLYDIASNEKIVTAPDYVVEVKDFASAAKNTLTMGKEIPVTVSHPVKNEYSCYKFDAQEGNYYIQPYNLDPSNVGVYYYDENNAWTKLNLKGKMLNLTNTTYYFIFYDYLEDYDTDYVDFGVNKKIVDSKLIPGKQEYLSLIDTPLSDWKLNITYDDETEEVYYLNQLDKYYDNLSGTDYVQDRYGNTMYCTFLKMLGNFQYEYVDGETGEYTLKVVVEENKPQEYQITITKPSMSDWKNSNRILDLKTNTVESVSGEERYFLFKPEKDGEYIFSDTKWTMDSDTIYTYDEDGYFSWADFEWDDSNSMMILQAKANTEYYFNPSSWYAVGTRTITIKEKNVHKHSYTSAVTKAPTCTTAGVRTYTCTAGDDSYTESIPATGHKLTTLPAKAATCTATGLTEGQKCSVCGTVTVSQQTTPVLGHAMGNWVTTQAPTALADGVQTRTCSRCGYAETAAITRLAATGSLNATNVPLKVKQSATLTVKDMAAGDYVASWTSSDTKIVTVNNGKITGKKKGTAKVTATLASGRVLTATIKVQTGNVKTTGITVNTRKIALVQGDVFQLVSSITPFTSKDKLSYKTSNKKVATVSKNGKITAKKAGKATITVKAGKKSVKVTVYVAGVKTTDLSVNTTQLNLKVKKKATIKAYVTPKNTSETVTYKTSNKKVATVDKKGKVTARKAGTATITVTSGSKSVKVNVAVTK